MFPIRLIVAFFGDIKGGDAFVVYDVALKERRVVLHVVFAIFDINGHDFFGHRNLALFTTQSLI